MKLNFSSFLKTKEKKGITAIFHTLHPYPIYINTKAWGRLTMETNNKKGNEVLIKSLQEQGLIIKSYRDDIKELQKIQMTYKRKISQMTNLYLVLTHKCNLECQYCFVSQSFTEKERKVIMTPDIAKRGIDLWAKHIKRNIVKDNNYLIIFYGGEPLMNLLTLQTSLEYIQELQDKKHLPQENLEKVIITNGTLINAKISKLLKKYCVGVTISIDGTNEIHDAYRIDKKGQGSFKQAKKAIKILQSEKIDIYASVTVTPYNIELIKEIPRLLNKMGIKELGLNMLVAKTPFLVKPNILIKEYYKQATQEMIKTFSSARKIKIHEAKLGIKVDAFTQQEFYPPDCMAYGGQIVVQPNGLISPCHANSKYNIRHIENWDKNLLIQDTSIVKKWRKRLPLYNEKCLKCEAISICGGGCLWSTEEIGESPMKKDKASCIYTKEAFKFIVWDSYK